MVFGVGQLNYASQIWLRQTPVAKLFYSIVGDYARLLGLHCRLVITLSVITLLH